MTRRDLKRYRDGGMPPWEHNRIVRQRKAYRRLLVTTTQAFRALSRLDRAVLTTLAALVHTAPQEGLVTQLDLIVWALAAALALFIVSIGAGLGAAIVLTCIRSVAVGAYRPAGNVTRGRW